MWYNNSDKSRRPDRSLFSSWPILQKEQKMNRKENSYKYCDKFTTHIKSSSFIKNKSSAKHLHFVKFRIYT